MAKNSVTTAAKGGGLQGLFSEKQMAALLRLTGQAANFRVGKTPVLKVNKYPIEDVHGNTVPIGNFVLDQITRQEGQKTIIEFIGRDFGANPTLKVLKAGTKFSYFPESRDRRLICQSQLVLDPGERHRGGNLGFDCLNGGCPRRGKDVAKEEKCSCQYLAFIEIGPEKTRALMYFKGTSFLPFREYLDSLGKFPSFFYPTVLNTEQQVRGSNVYWIVMPTADKEHPYCRKEVLAAADAVKVLDCEVRDFEAQRRLVPYGRRAEGKMLPRPLSW